MANDVKWLKLMNNMFEDEKIEYIESLPDGDAIIVIWVKILCLASKSNENGNLMITSEIPYTPELLAHKFGKTPVQIDYALNIMRKLEMVDVVDNIICVSNWSKYQNLEGLAKIREQTRLRVAKHREKKKLEQNCNATLRYECNENALNSNSISTNNIIISNNKEDNNLIEYRIDKEEQLGILCKEYITTRNNKSESRKNYYAYLDGKKIITGTKKVCKLNHIQILLATRQYIAECKNKDLDTNLVLLLSTFLNGRLLDYVEKTKSVYERVMEKQYGKEWDKVRYKYQ